MAPTPKQATADPSDAQKRLDSMATEPAKQAAGTGKKADPNACQARTGTVEQQNPRRGPA
jgi:hypothetical protein